MQCRYTHDLHGGDGAPDFRNIFWGQWAANWQDGLPSRLAYRRLMRTLSRICDPAHANLRLPHSHRADPCAPDPADEVITPLSGCRASDLCGVSARSIARHHARATSVVSRCLRRTAGPLLLHSVARGRDWHWAAARRGPRLRAPSSHGCFSYRRRCIIGPSSQGTRTIFTQALLRLGRTCVPTPPEIASCRVGPCLVPRHRSLCVLAANPAKPRRWRGRTRRHAICAASGRGIAGVCSCCMRPRAHVPAQPAHVRNFALGALVTPPRPDARRARALRVSVLLEQGSQAVRPRDVSCLTLCARSRSPRRALRPSIAEHVQAAFERPRCGRYSCSARRLAWALVAYLVATQVPTARCAWGVLGPLGTAPAERCAGSVRAVSRACGGDAPHRVPRTRERGGAPQNASAARQAAACERYAGPAAPGR